MTFDLRPSTVSWHVKLSTNLGDLDALGLGMVGVGAADEEAEELVKLLPAVSVHGAAHGPHRAEEEQALQPQRDLMDGRIETSLSSMRVW